MKTTTALRIVFGIFVLIATTLIYAQTSPTAPESPSELLEKGIYNQDTKGDLDSAITIYQQVVAQSASNQSLAAQAQFRLGQCYLKKNRPADATAAFEKLIHDFPNEKALIVQAREYLPSGLTLGPVPWVDGERMQLNISVASGADIGTAEYRADLVQRANGGKIWRVGCRMMAGPQSVSSVDVDSETFRPISSH
jgi:tetratricopeptide (TPR) repeat protein